MSRGSAVGVAIGYGLDDYWGRSSSPDRVKDWHLSILSSPALGSTQPPTEGSKAQGASS
jgi:hypothetical protein